MANKIEKLKTNIKENYEVLDEAKLDKYLKGNESNLSSVKRELAALDRYSASLDKNVVKVLTDFCKSINSSKSNYTRLVKNVTAAKAKTKAKIEKLAKKGKTDPVLEKDLKKITESEEILAAIARKRTDILKLINDIKGIENLAPNIKSAKTDIKQLNRQIKTREALAKLPFKSKNNELEQLKKQRDRRIQDLQNLLDRRTYCHEAIEKALGGNINSYAQAYNKQLALIEKNFVADKNESKISVITSKNIELEIAALRFSANRAFGKVKDTQTQIGLITGNIGVDVKSGAKAVEPQQKDENKEKGQQGGDDKEKGGPTPPVLPGMGKPPVTSTPSQPQPPKPQPAPVQPTTPKPAQGTDQPVEPIVPELDVDNAIKAGLITAVGGQIVTGISEQEQVKLLSDRLSISQDLVKSLRQNKQLDLFDYSVIADFINKNNCNGKETEIINLFGLCRTGGISQETLDSLLRTMTHPKLEVTKSIVDVPKTSKEFAKEYGLSEEYAYEIYRVSKADIPFVAKKIIDKKMTLEEAREYIDQFKEISDLKSKEAPAKKSTTRKTTKTSTKKPSKSNSDKAKKEEPVVQTVEPVKAEEPIKEAEPVIKNDPIIEDAINKLGDTPEIKTEVLGTDVNEKEPVTPVAIPEAPNFKDAGIKEEYRTPDISELPVYSSLGTPKASAEPKPEVKEEPEVQTPVEPEKTEEVTKPAEEQKEVTEPVSEPTLIESPAPVQEPVNVVEPTTIVESPAPAQEPTPVEPQQTAPEAKPENVTVTVVPETPEIPVKEENVSAVKKVVAIGKDIYIKTIGRVKNYIVTNAIDSNLESPALDDGGRNR